MVTAKRNFETNKEYIEALMYERIVGLLNREPTEEGEKDLSPNQLLTLVDAYTKLEKLHLDRKKEGDAPTVVVAFPALP